MTKQWKSSGGCRSESVLQLYLQSGVCVITPTKLWVPEAGGLCWAGAGWPLHAGGSVNESAEPQQLTPTNQPSTAT